MSAEENVNDSGRQVIEAVKGYLEADNMRFSQLDEEALELYMQGHNLTMHLVIYLHNSHLIFRVPNFIRNVDLNRKDVLQFIMQVTNEILDIRFELGKDGRSLSACCQHILEDGWLTRKQFDLAMMVLVHMVDDTFPRFMEIIYGRKEGHEETGQQDDNSFSESKTASDDSDEVSESDDFAPVSDDEKPRKIN